MARTGTCETQEKLFNDRDGQAKSAEAALIAVEQRKLSAESELVKTQLELQQLKRQKSDLAHTVQHLQVTEGELSSRRHEVPHLNAQLADARDELADLQSQLRNTRLAVDEAESRRMVSQEALLKAAADVRKSRNAADELTSELSKLRADHTQLQQRVVSLRDEQHSLLEAARSAETQGQTEMSAVQAARAQLASQRREVAKVCPTNRVHLVAQNGDETNFSICLVQATQELARLRTETSAAKIEAARVQADLDTTRAEQEALSTQAAHAHRTWELGQQVAQTGAHAADVQRRAAHQETKRLQERNQQLVNEIAASAKELQELRNRLHSERGQAAKHAADADALVRTAEQQVGSLCGVERASAWCQCCGHRLVRVLTFDP